MSLLDKLQRKEDICRELECKIEDVEGKIHTAERIHREHLGTLVNDVSHLGTSSEKEHSMDEIKEKLLELESQQKELLEEEVTLQHSFVEHSEQQALIAQDLVGKVKQLQDNITTVGTTEPDNNKQQPQDNTDSFSHLQELTSQLIQLAEKLEHAVGERNQEISLLRKALNTSTTSRTPSLQKLRLHQHWFSTDSMSSIGVSDFFPTQNSEDLTNLPVLLTNKLQELKSCLGALTPTSDLMSQPELSNRRTLSVVYPESPEIETTFVFNIRKKSKTEILTAENEAIKSKRPEKEWEDETSSSNFNQNQNFKESSSSYLTTDEQNASSSSSYWNKDIHELRKGNECTNVHNTESIVEFTYPLKTYFREDTREKRFRRKSGHVFSDSDDTDSETNSANKSVVTICKGSMEGLERDKGQESVTVKKYKRTRHNSGLLERRRSRTDSKHENSDEELSNAGFFESCTIKKYVNYEDRYKKSNSNSKIKPLPRENEDEDIASEAKEDLSNNTKTDPEIETTEVNIKPLHSPKCNSRRLKKSTKNSKESKSLNDSKCMSYNFCCNASNEEIIHNQEMTVNVFVPTTRKIFSPVRKDSKGETSTVISYVVEESLPGGSCDLSLTKVSDVQEETKKNNDQGKVNWKNNVEEETVIKQEKDITSWDSKEIKKEKENIDENKNEEKPKFDFIMPPCWIIKQVRAQSASPALQRRTIQSSWSKERITDRENSERLGSLDKKQDLTSKSKILKPEDMSGSNTTIKSNDLETCIEEKVINSPADTGTYTQKENCRKNSSSSESVENSRSIRKEGNSIPSSLKLRSEAGFPPISPLTVRREMKVIKETAPSIRMMIAKYNQKVHESQELSGTKSPDSGGQSPVAWRSPIAERRLKSQMDKYQDEVRKAFQSSSKTDFYPYAALGQVQKSASAGYIRPFEKECSNDSINYRSEGKGLPQASYSQGILKSSSVGAIKSMSPLPPKRQNVNGSNLSLKRDYSTPFTSQNTTEVTTDSNSKLEQKIFEQTDLDKHCRSSNCKKINLDTEHVKIPHIPPIPVILHDDSLDYHHLDNSPQSTRLRALRIKKAKEEFLSRGCVRNSGQSGCQSGPSTPDTPSQSERMPWTDSKSRLSQISCGSESSYENVPMILVSGKDPSRDQDGALLVKSASAGMINIDSAASSRVFSDNQLDHSEQGTIPKSKSGILSRFRKARLKRHKDKEHPKLDTVSTLCRQSLVVDINKRNQNGSDPVPSSSKSCPSSPVLHKKEQTASSGRWIRNPKRIFKPK